MFLDLKQYSEFLVNLNKFRDNIRLTNKIYKGHSIVLDNLIYKLIRYFLDFKNKKFNDPEFKEFILKVYSYSVAKNPELKNISTKLNNNYCNENNFLDGTNKQPGQRYPEFDIVLGVISGIEIKDIKGFVEIGNGYHGCFKNIKTDDNNFWTLYNKESVKLKYF